MGKREPALECEDSNRLLGTSAHDGAKANALASAEAATAQAAPGAPGADVDALIEGVLRATHGSDQAASERERLTRAIAALQAACNTHATVPGEADARPPRAPASGAACGAQPELPAATGVASRSASQEPTMVEIRTLDSRPLLNLPEAAATAPPRLAPPPPSEVGVNWL